VSASVLIAARRSAVVPRGGALSHLSLEELAKPVLEQAIEDAQIRMEQVDEVILANALGGGGNPARIVALNVGLSESVAGLTIDRQCSGGLDAITLADALIRSGSHQVVIAGGVESYSRRPLRYRTFHDDRVAEQYDQAQFTPWPDRDPDMAVAADQLASKYGISKAEQDAWAIESHRKAIASQSTHSTARIVEVAGVTKDAFPRNLSMALCNRASSVSGSISVANMAVAADCAAVVVMTSADFVEQHGLQGLKFISGISVGAQPDMPGEAPIMAIKTLLKRTGIAAEDLSHIEIMEAFAVQALVCQQGAQLPLNLVNLEGGSLARGHPIGASGAILAVNIFDELTQRPGFGLAAIAAAGGIGSAALFGALSEQNRLRRAG
jgi:acetyl-CoA C-acetyltransferase